MVTANKDFSVLFEGIVGNGINGNIAIDDYNFKERECEPLGNCDFEEDLCKYK